MTGEGCHEDRPWLLSKEKASGKGKITDKLTVPCLEGGANSKSHLPKDPDQRQPFLEAKGQNVCSKFIPEEL